jgi:hypothetical protein
MKDQIIVVRGELYWAKITGDARPYTGNPKYDKGPNWSVDIIPDAASRKTIKAAGIEGKLRNGSDNDTRKETFLTLRHLLNRPDGKQNDPPVVKDAAGNPWTKGLIGNGSIGDIKIKVKDYGSGSDKGAYYQAARILQHVPYESNDFAPLSEDDEFFASGTSEDEADSKGFSPESDDLEDDAPF